MIRPRLCRFALVALAAFVAGCGGDSTTAPTGSAPDFALTVSLPSPTVQAGGSPASVNVAVTAKNGFASLVTLTLSGAPDGSSVQPAPPISVVAGTTQTFTVAIPRNTAPRGYTLTAVGTSGSLAHDASAVLTVAGG